MQDCNYLFSDELPFKSNTMHIRRIRTQISVTFGDSVTVR
jgi:hypothetical protein